MFQVPMRGGRALTARSERSCSQSLRDVHADDSCGVTRSMVSRSTLLQAAEHAPRQTKPIRSRPAQHCRQPSFMPVARSRLRAKWIWCRDGSSDAAMSLSSGLLAWSVRQKTAPWRARSCYCCRARVLELSCPAPYLHAGTVVSLADICAACRARQPFGMADMRRRISSRETISMTAQMVQRLPALSFTVPAR